MRKPNNWLVAIPALAIHTTVAVLTWRDIAERSDRQVRGPKNLWRAASVINTLGSLAYWVAGRKS